MALKLNNMVTGLELFATIPATYLGAPTTEGSSVQTWDLPGTNMRYCRYVSENRIRIVWRNADSSPAGGIYIEEFSNGSTVIVSLVEPDLTYHIRWDSAGHLSVMIDSFPHVWNPAGLKIVDTLDDLKDSDEAQLMELILDEELPFEVQLALCSVAA